MEVLWQLKKVTRYKVNVQNTASVMYIGCEQNTTFLKDTILGRSKKLNSNNQFKMYLWDL